MAADTALKALRAADPAATLAPLPAARRHALRAAAVADGQAPRPAPARRRRHVGRLALAVAAAALVLTGIAWAAGALSPVSLFQANPQSDGAVPGSLWDQQVIAGSVTQVGSVDIPDVGAVTFWYGRTSAGGWCAGLRLPGGDWLGTGKSRLDGGGTVPGCFPTREQVNGASKTPVYVLNGFDYVESDVNAGAYWRIRYGRITAPGAARVVDLDSRAGANVVDGDLFLLAVKDPDPTRSTAVHLVAYDRTGTLVADDCPSCGAR